MVGEDLKAPNRRESSHLSYKEFKLPEERSWELSAMIEDEEETPKYKTVKTVIEMGDGFFTRVPDKLHLPRRTLHKVMSE